MKFALVLACLMAITCYHLHAAPRPGPPPLSDEFLSSQCQTPKCPEDINANLTYPMDCLLYIKCNQGVAKVMACPSDNHFNEATGTCMDRATANCVVCWQKAPRR